MCNTELNHFTNIFCPTFWGQYNNFRRLFNDSNAYLNNNQAISPIMTNQSRNAFQSNGCLVTLNVTFMVFFVTI